MATSVVCTVVVCAVSILSGCTQQETSLVAVIEVPSVDASESRPGGDTTVSILPFPQLDKVIPNLPQDERPDFFAGRALAEQPWVKAPTITDTRDGLGPIYNARSCLACHVRGGKGVAPDSSDSPMISSFVRLSLPGAMPRDEQGISREGVIPEPTYGDQLQTQSVSIYHQLRQMPPQDMAAKGEVPPEAYAYLNWIEFEFIYPDGKTVSLRKPELDIRDPGYGDFHPDTLFSIRNAPTIHGMGLLELIPEARLLALADPEDANQDGISGRANRVWDAVTGEMQMGRFGHKANRPNIDMIVASAFANDIGISNPLFPKQPCSMKQSLCMTQVNGNDENGVEMPYHLLDLVTDFARRLAVPQRRNASEPEVLAGRSLFYESGCSSCHQPDYTTGQHADRPELSNQRIWPYTDLLLHDMGSGLADGRSDFEATGSEWRTPPLWGAGLLKKVNGIQVYLHDGRARTIEEAILWHGGEAEQAKSHFVQLDQSQREQLIKFVNSL